MKAVRDGVPCGAGCDWLGGVRRESAGEVRRIGTASPRGGESVRIAFGVGKAFKGSRFAACPDPAITGRAVGSRPCRPQV